MSEIVKVPDDNFRPQFYIPEKYILYRADLSQRYFGRRAMIRKFDSPDGAKSIMVKMFVIAKESSEYIEEAKLIRREVNVLASMNHKNIVRLLESYEGTDKNKSIFIISEYCGPSLESVIVSSKYSLDSVKKWSSELLSALIYLNSLEIIHRNLQPNTMCISCHDQRLIVQGLSKARKQDHGKPMTRVTSNSPYQAIEIQIEWIGSYDEKVDIWSVAVILCKMICGKQLFGSSKSVLKNIVQDCGILKKSTLEKIGDANAKEIISKICAQRIDFIKYMKEKCDVHERIINNMDNENEANLKDFIERTLQLDPDDRMSADEAFAHSFLRRDVEGQDEAEIMRQQILSTVAFSIESANATGSIREGIPIQDIPRIESDGDIRDRNSDAAEVQEKEQNFISEFSKLNLVKIIGQGSYGCVFEVEYSVQGSSRITTWKTAVKRIALRGSSYDVDNAFNEVSALINLRKDGIVRFMRAWKEKPPKGWQRSTDERILNDFLGNSELSLNRFFAYSDDCAFLYIETEMCKSNLATWLSENAIRDLKDMKKWFHEMITAVGYIHEKKYVHRDLKPSNILIDENNHLQICDLGIVAERIIEGSNDVTEDSEDRSYCVGTKMYMAPEQMSLEAKYNQEVDIFTLGLILAQLCVVMTIEDAIEIFDNYRKGRPNTVLDHIPEVKEVVEWMTKVNGAERPDCKEILAHRFFTTT